MSRRWAANTGAALGVAFILGCMAWLMVLAVQSMDRPAPRVPGTVTVAGETHTCAALYIDLTLWGSSHTLTCDGVVYPVTAVQSWTGGWEVR